jgi:ABC-type phosphate/phosphonate transport system ATPase subunit
MSLKGLDVPVPGMCLFYAASGSGKTHFLKCLLHAHRKRFDRVYIISPTADCPTSGWAAHVKHDRYLMLEFDSDLVARLIALNKQVVEAGGSRQVLFILDDVMGSVRDMRSDLWTSIATRLRHYQCSFWIAAQHPFGLPPVIRSNAHMSFVFRQNNLKNAKFVYEELAQNAFPTFQEFKAWLPRVTQSYGVVAIRNNSDSRQVVRAPGKVPKFRV